MNKKDLILIIVILLIVLFAWIYFRYFFNLLGKCESTVNSSSMSPTSDYLAQKLIVNCGATSDYSTEFLLKNLETNNQETILSLKGHLADRCNLVWRDNAIIINCSSPVDYIYKQEEQFENFKVEFYIDKILHVGTGSL